MRWARFEADGKTAYGIVDKDNDGIEAVIGDPFEGYERTGIRRSLASVRLLCPVEPRTVYAAGLNYAAHVTALANQKGETPKLPPAADIGYRGSNALIAFSTAAEPPMNST